MATVTVTNLTEQVVHLQELYVDLAPNSSLDFEHTEGQLRSMPNLQQLWHDGEVSVSIAMSTAERNFLDQKLGSQGGSANVPLGEMIEVCASSAPGSVYGNGIQFVPLRQGQADTITVEFVSGLAGDLELFLVYAMSAANGGDIALRMDMLKVTVGGDPSAALSPGTPGVVTPGNDASMHIVNSTTFAGFLIGSVTKGDFVHCVVSRPVTSDTHTGDMRILKVGVRAL